MKMDSFYPPQGNVRGSGRSVTNLGGRRRDWLFPGETTAQAAMRRASRTMRRCAVRKARISKADA